MHTVETNKNPAYKTKVPILFWSLRSNQLLVYVAPVTSVGRWWFIPVWNRAIMLRKKKQQNPFIVPEIPFKIV